MSPDRELSAFALPPAVTSAAKVACIIVEKEDAAMLYSTNARKTTPN